MSEKTAFMDGAATNFEGWSRWMTKLLTQGVASGLAVSQKSGGANMSVDISAGDVIPMTTNTAPYSWETGTYNIAIGAASANNRRDIVVAYVDLSIAVGSTATPNNPGALKFKVVQGTPAGSPTDPSDATIQAAVGSGYPWVKLGRVSLTSSTTQITNLQITDLRQFAALNMLLIAAGSVTPAMLSKFPVALTPKSANAQTVNNGSNVARVGLSWSFVAPFTGIAKCRAALWGRPSSATLRDGVAFWLKNGTTGPDLAQGGFRAITPSDNPGMAFNPFGAFSITAGVSYTLAVFVLMNYNPVDFEAGDWGEIDLFPTEFTMVA